MNTPTTDAERWEALGRPDVICTECKHYCFDHGLDRVCELCARPQPEKEGDCPDCSKPVWWVPKCPECGGPCDWTYGRVGEGVFNVIRSPRLLPA